MLNYLPLTAVGMPLIGAPIVYFLPQRNRLLRNSITLGITLFSFVSVLLMLPAIEAGIVIEKRLKYLMAPMGLTFRVDELDLFLALITCFLWVVVTIYSFVYMENKHYQSRFYAAFLVALSGCLGVALTGGLLSLFIFFELASLVPYILIVHSETKEAVEASNKYLFMCLLGSLSLFFGISMTYYYLGTVDLKELQLLNRASTLPWPIFATFFIGFGIKSGLFPLHIWLPDAHPIAPSPISSLLSGITIKVGIYGIIRLVYNIYHFDVFNQVGWGTFLRITAAITIMFGSGVALSQKNLKRLLAYSSISQIGYVLLGIALLNERALFGAIFHIFSHAFMKGTLFLCAGAIKHKTGKTNIDEMKGIGREMPLTMICFTIASLAMIGIPPLNGFISKWYLGLGSLDADMPFYLIILLISSLLNGVYFLPIIINAFFDKQEETAGIKLKFNEVPVSMMGPMMVLTFGIVVGGIYEHTLIKLARTAAKLLFS
ncbi:Hydrogenase-4 component B [Koleobacter methoxysyntrophicus]|uniref:Hydrogenase-4 component B n=1 Tax=Koleobacter methoxysyntrophicus TaxID=2751313 RepID=A0A8A0RLL6_9FIRM|nr:monovalent cation/H+ antiporter subunit D family protein [Koleobacter methoxysyntrophicus]QSQ08357.1 Hydrogenase-4 component B [Koleobacter methoxysyntrophicus]